MTEQKNKELPDQTGSRFLNRGLFSDHFLKARLPQWKEWQQGEELAIFRKQLLSLYESKKLILPFLNEAQTEDEFVRPVLDLLGYADSYIVQAPTQVGQQTNRPDYALFPDQTTKNKAYEKLKNNDYTLCIGVADAKYWERELDLTKSSDRDTFTNQNPSFQIASYLTGTKQTWGILTNGRLWRLYCARSHLPLGNYYQVDLVQLLEKAPGEGLKYFYLFFRKAALIQADGKSFLDHVLEESNQYAVELEADIKERAYEVVAVLCRGFAAGFSNDQLTEQTLKTIYDNSLTLLYRLLFVFYAEARGLLPLTTNQSYRDKYSSHKLTQEIDETLAKGYPLSSKSATKYQYISSLFKLVNEGDPDLGVPEYNGGLFDPEEHPFLEKHAIADASLVQAIQQLARIPDKKLGLEVAVDYNTLSERHLGSIYEGLLEFKPRIAASDLVTIKDRGSIKYAPADKYPDKKIACKKNELYLANDKGERKASGSYYTPEYIVNYIVENTLDPLVKEAQEKTKSLKPLVEKEIVRLQLKKKAGQDKEPTEKYDLAIAKERERLLEPYLALKVLDPAMGSGHFLARTTDFLAEAIATDPYIEPALELAEDSELTYYRRRVAESCIYGVDLNPLAVELAKLTLWLSTMAKSRPLSFLNHHLRVGNSLIGARVADLDEIPEAKRKKGKPIDLSRAPVQIGQFEWAFDQKLAILLKSRALIAQTPTNTLEDVHNKEKWEHDFEHNMRRFRTLADLRISTYFGNSVAWDEYNTLVENLQSPEPEWAKLLQKESAQRAIGMRGERHFFHWELEFPEVFYDEKGNRKSNPGFDAVIGNPPWALEQAEILKHYYSEAFVTVSGKPDSFRVFIERSLSLTKVEGLHSFISPNTFLTIPAGRKLRELLISKFCPISFALVPTGAFPDVAANMVIYVFSNKKMDSGTSVVIHDWSNVISDKTSRVVYPFVWVRSPDKRIDLYTTTEIDNVLGKIKNISFPLHVHFEYVLGLQVYHNTIHSREEIANRIFHAKLQLDSSYRPQVGGGHLFRYGCNDENLEWVKVTERCYSCPPDHFFDGPRIILREISDTKGLVGGYCETQCYSNKSTIVIRKKEDHPFDLTYLLAIVNSSLIGSYFHLTSEKSQQELFPRLSLTSIRELPIRRINFTTPEKDRKELLEKGKELYQEYLKSHDWSKVLAFVGECLPQKADGSPDTEQEKSDVIHDLLAFLAGEMTQLNKEKQSRIKGFLTWLEKEILKGSVEEQKNKTRIKGFHNNTFEDLLEVLKKNKVVPDPCPSNMRDTIAGEFSVAVNALTPLKAHIKATDSLIDRVVYRLYGLTNAEIAIVEGPACKSGRQQSHAKQTEN